VSSTLPSNVTIDNTTRYLVYDADFDGIVEEANKEEEEFNKDEAPFAYDPERKNSCQKVDAKLVDNAANRKMCQAYLDLPLIKQDESSCTATSTTATTSTIPKVYYSVSRDNKQSPAQIGISASNPDYERRHFGDAEALEFIQQNCGDDAAQAYQCLAPPAYRADLFRFCALWSNGGIYMDSDMLPIVPLEDLYDRCSIATIGHDWPQGRPQKQMKILAGQPGAPIFECMIETIVGNVRSRSYPNNPLALTGPMVLHDCYVEHSEGVSVTYHDTRDAAYPYSGMRAGEDLLAFEIPVTTSSHHDDSLHNYKIDFDKHEVYRPTCSLHNLKKEGVAVATQKQEPKLFASSSI